VPQLWQLLTTGFKVQPPHPIVSRIPLPFPSLLQALGMQLTAQSITDDADKARHDSKLNSSHRSRNTSNPDSGGQHGSVRDDSNSNTDSLNKDHVSVDSAGRKGGPSSPKRADKHLCWQPVLLAYAQSGSGNKTALTTNEMPSGAEQTVSAREVIRTNPAELSLWAIEASGKEIGVLSDPTCVLHLR